MRVVGFIAGCIRSLHTNQRYLRAGHARGWLAGAFVLGVLLVQGCEHLERDHSTQEPTQLLSNLRKLRSTVQQPIYVPAVRSKLERFERVLRSGSAFSERDWALHDELLNALVLLRNDPSRYPEHLVVPARSQRKIHFLSFCLDSGKASPVSNEHFRWLHGSPDIAYYREILSYWHQHPDVEHSDVQALLWNLSNATQLENYPRKLRTILLTIDSAAAVKIPSRAQSGVASFFEDTVAKHLPGYGQVKDAYEWGQGEYRSYEDIADQLLSLRSAQPLQDDDKAQLVEGSALFASTQAHGFSSVDATLFNPTDEDIAIDLTTLYLSPDRDDVQRLAIAPRPDKRATGPLDALERDLEQALYPSLLRIGIGFTPVIGDIADLYELISGKDYSSGAQLSVGARALSGVGVVFGSGANYRFAKRLTQSADGTRKVFERGLSKVSSRSVTNLDFKDAAKALETARSAAEQIKSVVLLKKLVERNGFRKSDFYVRKNGDVIPSRGYRYVSSRSPDTDEMIRTGIVPPKTDGNYITFEDFRSSIKAKDRLQVPHEARYKFEFDTKQVLEDLHIPGGKWGELPTPEPLTKTFPEFGKGGATQAVTQKGLKASRIVDLENESVVYEH